MTSSFARRTLPAVVAAVSFVLLFHGVLSSLVHDWIHDGNYSHGFLIVPVAAYLVWERRKRLASLPPKPSWLGLVIVAGGVLVLLVGLLGAELFLSRIAMLGVLAGGIVFVLGWRHLRALLFPLAFMLLMIPIPAIVFNQIALPLQLLASRFGEATLHAASIPVLREGNVITLAHTTLEVAEACSGIRSLISLLTLGIVYGYFSDPRASVRVALAVMTIPIAIVTNGARVAGTGIAAHYFGAAAAEGFFHEFSGWAIFVAAFVLMFLVLKVIVRIMPRTVRRTPLEPAGANV